MAEVSYFGENWSWLQKLTLLRSSWNIIKSRYHPNTLSCNKLDESHFSPDWPPKVLHRFHDGTSLTPRHQGKKERSPKKQRERIKPQQTENTPQPKGHTEAAGTLWSLVHPYGHVSLLILGLLPFNWAFSSHLLPYPPFSRFHFTCPRYPSFLLSLLPCFISPALHLANSYQDLTPIFFKKKIIWSRPCWSRYMPFINPSSDWHHPTTQALSDGLCLDTLLLPFQQYWA